LDLPLPVIELFSSERKRRKRLKELVYLKNNVIICDSLQVEVFAVYGVMCF